MTIMDLERAAAQHGLVLIPADMREDLLDAVLEAEALRCDLELLSATLVEDFTAGLGSR